LPDIDPTVHNNAFDGRFDRAVAEVALCPSEDGLRLGQTRLGLKDRCLSDRDVGPGRFVGLLVGVMG
jgi:hypothetical protein